MMILYNFDELKKGQVPAKQRELMRVDLQAMLLEKYGEENVTQVGNNTFAVCLGLRTLDDGTQAEICNEISFTAKPYELHIVESSGKKVKPYERNVRGDDFEEEQRITKEKEEQKAKEKAEREEKLKKAKEQAKKEKEEKARQNNEDNG